MPLNTDHRLTAEQLFTLDEKREEREARKREKRDKRDEGDEK